MSISVDVSDRVSRLPEEIRQAISNMDFVRLGIAGMASIKDRTNVGLDVLGAPFKPYSDVEFLGVSYKDRRAEAGLPTDHVDLVFYGNMMAAMDVEAGDFSAFVGFRSPEEAGKAAHNQETRDFFDLNENEVDDALIDVVDLIIEEIARGSR